MCRRPESKTGRMLHIPGMNNMCICIDCMERSFRVMDGSNYADLMQGMNIQDLFPGGLNMDDMLNLQNQIPKKQTLKKKAKCSWDVLWRKRNTCPMKPHVSLTRK